jgi:hypothetical protein
MKHSASAEGEERMPEIVIPDEMLARVAAFTQVVEAVIDEKIGLDECVRLVLDQGINSILGDLLGSVEASVLLTSLEQLGSQYPKEVYGYIAETLRRGQAAQEREKLKHKLGFGTSCDTGGERCATLNETS